MADDAPFRRQPRINAAPEPSSYPALLDSSQWTRSATLPQSDLFTGPSQRIGRYYRQRLDEQSPAQLEEGFCRFERLTQISCRHHTELCSTPYVHVFCVSAGLQCVILINCMCRLCVRSLCICMLSTTASCIGRGGVPESWTRNEGCSFQNSNSRVSRLSFRICTLKIIKKY